ncbi:18642_t:CDS:2, partial [Dentiscutata erythropus]
MPGSQNINNLMDIFPTLFNDPQLYSSLPKKRASETVSTEKSPSKKIKKANGRKDRKMMVTNVTLSAFPRLTRALNTEDLQGSGPHVTKKDAWVHKEISIIDIWAITHGENSKKETDQQFLL